MTTTTQAMAGTWWCVLAAYLLMYVPTYFDLFKTFADTQYGSHGPIVIVACIWLIWRERTFFSQPMRTTGSAGAWLLVIFGLMLFVLGRSQTFYQFEVGSQLPLLTGIILLMYGWPGLRRFWFPIFLLLFVIPIPGSILDQILLFLKQWVSAAADTLLHWAGYPTARSGVVLSIGPYQLLMADACSGLNSIIALTGVSFVYVYLNWSERSALVSGMLLASILPIALIANVARVVMLMLATYYGGESVGQMLHDYAGYLEMAMVFGGLFGLDKLMHRLRRDSAQQSAIATSGLE
ncbi:MAG: exosortase [Steroidobacteraceae bacterium]